jgi:hypothetical protein
MMPEVYSSLAAFLAHWQVLRHASAGGLAAAELARRAEMEKIIAILRPEERAALEAANPGARASTDDRSADGGTARRHRERADLKLARELRTRGMLAI